MNEINRRAFLATSAGAAASLGVAARADQPARPAAPAPAAGAAPPRPPQVQLGRTNVRLSRLAMGTGVHGGDRQSDQSRMGFERLVALFRHAYDRGITFFDLADLYGTHLYFREALRHIPRDRVTILTKLWWRYDGDVPPAAEAYRRRVAATALQRFCHELNTDHLDIVLLHCMTVANWDALLGPYMEALSDAKRRGQVRAVGVSCHDLGALNRAAAVPWVDVVLARINLRGGANARMDGTTEEVTAALRRIKQAGKAVIGMKIFGEGTLANQKEQCIRFAQGLGLLDAMTIGFHTPAQIDEVLRLLARHPAAPIRNS
jgi:aryl-alcohol dehydrogenase-like predicted oxidoreductase